MDLFLEIIEDIQSGGKFPAIDLPKKFRAIARCMRCKYVLRRYIFKAI